MNILMVSGESLPFSKTGGLGDVVYSLSREFAKQGENVSIVAPYYSTTKYEKFPAFSDEGEITVTMNWRKSKVKIQLFPKLVEMVKQIEQKMMNLILYFLEKEKGNYNTIENNIKLLKSHC